VPLIGRIVTEANVRHFSLTRGNDGAHDFGNKVNGLILVKDMMLEPDQIANFNAVILSHCACSTIEIPVTVITPFVH
jgi:hypothetical protein